MLQRVCLCLYLALRDLVALCGTHPLVVCRAEAGAGGGWCTCVTGSDCPSVGQVGPCERTLPTPAKQIHSHLDAIATDLYRWFACHRDEMLSKSHANIEVALPSTISK